MGEAAIGSREVAGMLGVHKGTLLRRWRAGEFPAPDVQGRGGHLWNASTVERWQKGEWKKEGANPTPPEADPVELQKEKADQIRDLHLRRELLRDVGGELSFRRFLESLVREVVPKLPPVRPPAQAAATPRCSKETMILLLSDWHAYEVVKPERVLGFNEYNADVFGRRSKRVVDGVVGLKSKLERGGGWSFDKVVVSCNGDFISGTIHELERHSDAPNVLMAAYAAGRVLGQALRDLCAAFPQVDVVGVSGNHGRFPDARRMQQKDPWRNWDTLIYVIARTMLEAQPNVRFYIPDAYSAMFEVRGWTFLQNHGHEIKSWNSIPFYGLDRYARNVNALMVAERKPINYFLFSHFHSMSSMPAPGGETFINGSLIGGNEASVNFLGKCDRPKQLLCMVHEEHGVTGRWPIYADGGTGSYDVRGWEGLS